MGHLWIQSRLYLLKNFLLYQQSFEHFQISDWNSEFRIPTEFWLEFLKNVEAICFTDQNFQLEKQIEFLIHFSGQNSSRKNRQNGNSYS